MIDKGILLPTLIKSTRHFVYLYTSKYLQRRYLITKLIKKINKSIFAT